MNDGVQQRFPNRNSRIVPAFQPVKSLKLRAGTVIAVDVIKSGLELFQQGTGKLGTVLENGLFAPLKNS